MRGRSVIETGLNVDLNIGGFPGPVVDGKGLLCRNPGKKMVCVYPERTLEPPCWLITFPLPRGAGEANAMDMVPILTTVAQAVYSSKKIPHRDASVATMPLPEELKRFLSWWYVLLCGITEVVQESRPGTAVASNASVSDI